MDLFYKSDTKEGDILVLDQKVQLFEEKGLTTTFTITMGRFKIKSKSKPKDASSSSTSLNDTTKNTRIFKFAPQVVGQKHNYATFASIKEKIIRQAQVELDQGYDVKRSLESGKFIDFKNEKPRLEIINIEKIMAETDGVEVDKMEFYPPSRQAMEKEL